MGTQAPVEYAVAVDEYLAQAALGIASRRVYRVSLTGWAWPIVGKPIPSGAERRCAAPPIVPLALLDEPATATRLSQALAERAGLADAFVLMTRLVPVWIEIQSPLAAVESSRSSDAGSPTT